VEGVVRVEADDHSTKPEPGALALWMEHHRDELRILIELGAINWFDFASAFARAGYRDTIGRPVTPQAAQFIWSVLEEPPSTLQ
jgi:hypothetical protein